MDGQGFIQVEGVPCPRCRSILQLRGHFNYFLNLLLPFILTHSILLTSIVRQNKLDECQLQCPDSSCRRVKSVRHDSFFRHSHLSLFQQMLIICCFVEDMPVSVCARDVGVSKDSAIDYYDNLRGCYITSLEDNPIQFNSLGPYEVDEFLIQHVSIGRGVDANVWVMDIVERKTGLYWGTVVPSRSAEVLIPILQEKIPPNSLIFSDDWGAYQPLRRQGYRHYTVNHSAGEYSRMTTIQGEEIEISVNKLEGIHHAIRQRMMNKSRRNEERVELMLQEFIYRRSGRSLWDPFKRLPFE